MTTEKRTIVVSAYLRGPDHANKLRYLESLGRALDELGYRTVLVDLVPGKKLRSTCTTVSTPSFAIGPHTPPGVSAIRAPMLPEGVRSAAQFDAEMNKRKLGRAALKLIYYRAFMRDVLIEYTPALCLLWHQCNPQHLTLADLCAEYKIPVAFAEYGLLPGTIMLDAVGQMAESWVSTENGRFLKLPVEHDDRHRSERYLEQVRAEKRTRKPQTSAIDVPHIARELRSKNKKIIFYAGEHEFHSGILPSSAPRAKLHSPSYTSTSDALADVARIARRNDWHVLFKPHPLSVAAPSIANDLADAVTLVPGANVFDCIACTDVTTTILSQVSYLSLIHGRPVVLLGRNTLSGKNCVYEVADRQGLEQELTAAIRYGITPEQNAAWSRHAAQLCTHYLFAMDDDIEDLIGRGPEIAVRFLADLAKPFNAEVTKGLLHAQTMPFGDDLGEGSSPLRLRLAYRILRTMEPLLRTAVPGSVQ